LHYLAAENVPSASIIDRPPLLVRGVRVRPYEIAHGPGLRNIMKPIDLGNLVDEGDGRRETPVHTEDLRIDDGCEGKICEYLYDPIPYIVVSILPHYFVVESIGPR
jgi:hypothetical protein